MLSKGPRKIQIELIDGTVPVITIEADASFTAYGVSGGTRELLLGPFKADGRMLNARIPDGITHVEVATAKSTFWQYDVDHRPDGRERPDPTPLEIPVDAVQPPSLRDEMRRFIREEFSRVAESHEQETFEEANDFDIPGDDDPLSPYELIDMIPEEPIEDENPGPEGTHPAPQSDTPSEETPDTEIPTTQNADARDTPTAPAPATNNG